MSAKQNVFLPRSRGLSVSWQVLGFVLFFVPPLLRADSLEDATHRLALKVCLAPHKPSVRIEWLESFESSGSLGEARKKIFLDQLSACGISLTENSDAPTLRVAIHFTPTKALLTADSGNAIGGTQIHMVEVPRASLLAVREAWAEPHLTQELLWQQERPIQSAVEWLDPSTEERFLFLLSDGMFVRRRFENGDWKLVDSTEFPVPPRRSRFRDGAFFYSDAEKKLELLVGGKLCEFSTNGRVSFSCGESHLVEKVASLSTNCDETRHNLITGDGDDTQPDRIILTHSASAGVVVAPNEKYSASVDVPGPVLDISVTENAKTAFAVARNLSTGNYEVYRITAVCSP